MSKKAIQIISCVVLLAMAGSVSAATYTWDKGGTNKLWSTALNWSPDGVPTSADAATIGIPDANCVIDSTVTAVCTSVTVGGSTTCYLDMTGGTLTCATGSTSNSIIVGTGGQFIMSGGAASAPAGRLQVGMSGAATFIIRGGTLYAYDKIEIGKNTGGNATVLVQGGTLNFGTPGGNSTDLEIAGGAGKATFTITGGTVNVLDQIKLAAGNAAGVANLNLYGGTLNAASLYAVASVLGKPRIDITKGTMILTGDRTTLVNDYLNKGWIVAYNGTGTVIVKFDATANQTTVTGYKLDEYLPSNPSPADAAMAQKSSTLSWKPGIYAATHDVYFGTSFADVNNASRDTPLGVLVSKAQDANTYTPAGPLNFGQTYYWRIDEVNAPPTSTIYKGLIWSFTVEALATAIPSGSITATASSSAASSSPANTINGSGLTGDLHSMDGTTMWATSSTATGPAWIRYDFDRLYKLQDMWVWNYNAEFEYLLNFAMKNVTVEYSTDGTAWKKLGDYVLGDGPSAAGYAHDATISFGGLAVKSVKITASSNYGGTAYGLSEVRFYSIPVQARQPQPATGAQNVSLTPTLTWWAGREAVSHKVYLGTDANNLPLAGTVSATSYPVTTGLNLGTTYYWRVDEVNTASTVPTWTGAVWSFTTQSSLTVDNMESYDDKNNRIYNAWVDGYDTPTTNGCVVGYSESGTTGTFGETVIVHSGRQSMPVAYGTNGVTNSWATLTFATSQDWTQYGANVLSLYFYGRTTNTTTVPMWIKLTDQSGKTASVTYGTGAGETVANLAVASWAPWNIPLSGFSGVTLSKIKSITIGFGPGAGTGTIFIDDIQLGK